MEHLTSHMMVTPDGDLWDFRVTQEHMRRYSQRFPQGGRAKLECGQSHPIDWIKRGKQVLFISPCFLTVSEHEAASSVLLL